MKNIFNRFLLIVLSIVIFNGCNTSQSISLPSKESKSADAISSKTKNVGDDDKNSPECVRAKPESIIKKEKFPNTTFRLEKNKDFPFEYLGYETIQFDNGDLLSIENVGCENFTLIFRFETNRFSPKSDAVRFWYKKNVELIEDTLIGMREPNLISDQIKALSSYIKKTKQLKFDTEIEVQDDGIKETVMLKKVRKLKNGKFIVTLSFNTGPL